MKKDFVPYFAEHMKEPVSLKKMLMGAGILMACILLLNQLSGAAAEALFPYFFTPLQTLRCLLFGIFPFSIGDLLYLGLGLYLLYALIVFVRRWRQRTKAMRARGLLRGLLLFLASYLLLLMLWGLNYERPKLARQLSLDTGSVSQEELFLFDSFLVHRLNTLHSSYTALPLKQLSTIAANTYAQQNTPMKVSVKPTLLGSSLAYFGIEGYFNPFTGEAQVDKGNPAFMQPFVVAHEMAHQTGIAAEDDANLLAYIRCMESGDPTFEYSACLNIWLYTHRHVRSYDSTRAGDLKRLLNPVTLKQLDTLRQRSIAYQTVLDDMSSFIFDLYLRMGRQTDGIGSYRNVAYSALCWEKKKRTLPDGSIRFF
ncbi:MAG: DUF3810 family protein [Chitinophagaceae bacterium]|nr:DUF3810 family protein [Chitinophagaceae bacterium]